MERIGGEDTDAYFYPAVVVASFIGTTIGYDATTLSSPRTALFFPDVFFRASVRRWGPVLAYTTFAVGFRARPWEVVFGHYGDKIGRKAMLVTTVLIMGIATFLMGAADLLHADKGFLPRCILVVLRVLQGFGLGGGGGGPSLWPSSTRHEDSGVSTGAARRWVFPRGSFSNLPSLSGAGLHGEAASGAGGYRSSWARAHGRGLVAAQDHRGARPSRAIGEPDREQQVTGRTAHLLRKSFWRGLPHHQRRTSTSCSYYLSYAIAHAGCPKRRPHPVT